MCGSAPSFYRWRNYGPKQFWLLWGFMAFFIFFRGLYLSSGCYQLSKAAGEWMVNENLFWRVHFIRYGQWEQQEKPLCGQFDPFCRHCPSDQLDLIHRISGHSLGIFILWSLALCSFIFTGPALVFVLSALFMRIAGSPVFNLRSELNITTAIARDIHTCQPLCSVFVNSTPGRRHQFYFHGSTLLNGNYHWNRDGWVQEEISFYHCLHLCFIAYVRKALVSKL